jgi:hypothetical protein
MENILDTFDLPREYKGLKIYPVKIKDYYNFNVAIGCLLLDKNSIPDPKIISMTYLEYLYRLIVKDRRYISEFDYLLRLCFHLPDPKELKINYAYDKNEKPFFEIRGNIFYANDLEDIKKIICEQNLIKIEDENISKEARDTLQKAKNYRLKESGRKMAGLEDQIVCVLISTSLSLDDISNLTIRKFSKIIERINMKLNYQIYLSASLSGFVEFKDKSFIKHWMSEVSDDNDEYAEAKIDLQDVKDKVK